MELRLEYTKDYIFLLSLDNQIEKDNYYWDELVHPNILDEPLVFSGITYDNQIIQSTSGTTSPLSTSHLIIAYRKLNDEVSDLDLPLLPELSIFHSLERTLMYKIKEYRNSLADNPDNEVYKNNSLIIDSCFSSTLEIIEKVFSSDELEALGKYKLPVSFNPETVGQCSYNSTKEIKTKTIGDKEILIGKYTY